MSDAEIIKEFLVESYENLDRLDQDLIALEKDPTNRETLASIFRTIHTIKGTSGFLAFNQLEALTHHGESLLAGLRDGQLVLTPENHHCLAFQRSELISREMMRGPCCSKVVVRLRKWTWRA